MGITTATEQEGECFPYFSHYPAFGLPAEVVDCHVMVRLSLIHIYNQLLPSRIEERKQLLRELLGKTGKDFLIEQPFYCDYGYNIDVYKRQR